MKRIPAVLGLALPTLLAGAAFAATPTVYTHVGSPFTGTTDYTPPCPAAVTCVNQALGNKVTIRFILPDALPANMASTDITAQITAFSASDGVITYSDTDPQTRLFLAQVATDATGAIIPGSAAVAVTRDLTSATRSVGDRLAIAAATGGGDQSIINSVCSNGGGGDPCFNVTPDSATSMGGSTFATGWTSAPVVPAPTLGEWAMIALATLLGVAGLVGTRRRTV